MKIRPQKARLVPPGLVLLGLLGCATPPDRPAVSSYSCMVAVRDSVPPQGYDKRAHCMVSAGIAQRCSVFEADLAGLGKEFRDPAVLEACCAEAGY